MLNRVNKKTSRIYNSGAYPQMAYGKEAHGTSPTTIALYRTMAAEAVSSLTKGQCATTCPQADAGGGLPPPSLLNLLSGGVQVYPPRPPQGFGGGGGW